MKAINYQGKGNRFAIFTDGDYGFKVDEAANDWLSCFEDKIQIQNYHLYETESKDFGVRRHLVICYQLKQEVHCDN